MIMFVQATHFKPTLLSDLLQSTSEQPKPSILNILNTDINNFGWSKHYLYLEKMHMKPPKEPIFALSKSCENAKPRVEPRAFLDTLHPFLILWRLAGRCPYTLDGRKMTFKLFSFWALYSGISMAFQTSILFYSTYLVEFRSSTFDEKLLSGISFILNLAHALTPLIVWFEVPCIIKYFGKWNNFEDALGCYGVFMESKLKVWSFIALIVIIPYSLSASYLECMVVGHFIFFPAFLMVHANICITLYIWIFICSFICVASCTFHQYFLKVLSKRDLLRGDLAACRRNWLLLSQLSSDLGSTLGPTFIQFILISSTIAIVAAYAVIFIIREGFLHSWVFTCSIILVFLLSFGVVLALSEFSQQCTNKIGLNFTKTIVECDFSNFNHEVEAELNIFLKTIRRVYPDIILCGYVRVNRRLFISKLVSNVKINLHSL